LHVGKGSETYETELQYQQQDFIHAMIILEILTYSQASHKHVTKSILVKAGSI